MARFRITELEREEKFPVGGETVKIRWRPLSRVQKMEVVAALCKGDLGEAERLLLRYCIIGWSGVEDATGGPLAFSFDALDRVLGADDTLGTAVHDLLMLENGLAEGQGGPPLDGSATLTAPSSPSTAIAGT